MNISLQLGIVYYPSDDDNFRSCGGERAEDETFASPGCCLDEVHLLYLAFTQMLVDTSVHRLMVTDLPVAGVG